MNSSTISAIVAAVAALAAIVTACYTKSIVDNMNTQMQQFSDQEQTRLWNEHNWKLYEHHKELPLILPAWKGLTDKGWAWRVIQLDHLNLIRLAYAERNRGLVNEHDFEGHVLEAKFWFRDLWSTDKDPDLKEGREILRQLLRPEEGYTKEFRYWLKEKEIVPSNLMSD